MTELELSILLDEWVTEWENRAPIGPGLCRFLAQKLRESGLVESCR